MIKAVFYKEKNSIKGFELSGHSGYAKAGEDIICASVSSACYMCANTLIEIVGEKTDIKIDDGYMKLIIIGGKSESQVILKGLFLHIKALSQDYADYLIYEEQQLK